MLQGPAGVTSNGRQQESTGGNADGVEIGATGKSLKQRREPHRVFFFGDTVKATEVADVIPQGPATGKLFRVASYLV